MNKEEMLKRRIRNQLGIHWNWLKKKDYYEVADFIDSCIGQILKVKHIMEEEDKPKYICEICGSLTCGCQFKTNKKVKPSHR